MTQRSEAGEAPTLGLESSIEPLRSLPERSVTHIDDRIFLLLELIFEL